MQARLAINRFPSMFLAIVLGLAVALILGGALGYTLKPTSTTSVPARVIVVSSGQQSSTSADNACVWAGTHKEC